jgi:hypothetical protein
MKIQIKGKTMPLKNLDSARLRDVAELQQQTGWKLTEIRDQIAQNEVINAAVLVFLSSHASGAGMSWDDVQDLGFGDFRLVQEPGDTARGKKAKVDPQKPSGDSSPDAAPQAEVAPTED